MGQIEEKYNLVGAIIFFSYIVAALILTGLILHDLYGLSRRVEPVVDRSQAAGVSKHRILISILLATISFGTLSYFMLSFLILSYTSWSRQKDISLPLSLIGPSSMLGLTGERTSLQIWRWATSSTLFQDFAETIISPPSHYFWTQKALAYSFLWNCYMADKGTYLQVPRLWAYFALDQILPVSFTQNLFMIACQLIPTPEQSRTGQAQRSWKFRYAVIAVGSFYLVCLSGATLVVGSPSLFPVLFATRATLLTPLFFPMVVPKYRTTLIPSSIGINGGIYQGNFPLIIGMAALFETKWKSWEVMSVHQAFEALNSNPAVSALGYDFLIGLASIVIQIMMHSFNPSKLEASQQKQSRGQTKSTE